MSFVRTLVLAAGSAAWGAYNGRLLTRALHMLQLEGYQTGRFLRWSAAKPERWARADRAALALGTIALAGLAPRLGAVGWVAIGAWLWRGATFGTAKKPLVLTARARRLLAGEATVALVTGAGLAVALAVRGRTEAAGTALMAGVAAVSLAAPIVAASANLLLWPVEEAFRRYYLRDARRKLRAYRPTVVGVAGSYGKTSTKEFIATIAGARRRVLKPPGSYNTPMGLSRVIREGLRPDHEVFVAELGDYVPGDIRFLCDLVRPNIGVLTAIGPEHLERFKTIERVAEAKWELLESLPPDGVAVVNQDDPLARALGDRAEARGLRVVRYSSEGARGQGSGVRGWSSLTPGPWPLAPATVWARDVRTTREGLAFTVVVDGLGEARFEIGVLGRHNVGNVLAATAVALELGMSLDEAADAARGIAPIEHRLQPIRGAGGVLVIDDAFNSNPRGAAEALRVLGELEGGKRVLVTPGMIELAEREWEENRAFGRLAAEVCDEVILVGPERARPILAGLREGEFPAARTHVVRDLGEATARLGTLVQPGDVILFENDLPDQYDDGATPMGKSPHPNPLPEGEGVGLHPMPDSALPEGMRVVHVDGLRVAYRESGAGSPVIVLHGWGASSAAVTSILRCLEGEHRVIAPDLPGFGASDQPPDAWGSAEYAGCVRTFLRELGVERADFIGHSHGGRVAIRLATSDPGLVEKLVLVDSAGIRPRRGPVYRARVLAFKTGRRAVAAWGRAVGARNAAPVRAWFARRFGSEDYRQAGSMRGTLVRLVNEDARALLPRVQAPTLLIWGERDDATPVADGRLMERLIPDAGLVVFPEAGHFSYADDPGRFCRVVGHFLKG